MTTDTEDRAMAAAATQGGTSLCVAGYSAPAANGMATCKHTGRVRTRQRDVICSHRVCMRIHTVLQGGQANKTRKCLGKTGQA